ncbi:hypothetical protein DOTSEDRAFT_22906 [Dothistroma septosporum NZE10]|uniref:Uncharacterized protein n=1 Tax=Dothistroma septosporum (strain NZE10 / CBS 128990) TaxID=675120 RepID=N1PTW9_DOTSN|nr:hypothetical protein DOTSEDRAFT_22906 [Dothistroma septosporum NZE10]
MEFEHAGDVIDSMLNLMLINDERDRAVLLREKNVLRSQEEEFLDKEKRRHKYGRARLQEENKRAVSLNGERARSNHQSSFRRTASHGRLPNPSAPPEDPLSHIPTSKPRRNKNTARKEELATLSQPRDERFVQQQPRRRHCEDDRVQTIIIARDDPNLARLQQAAENKRHATIVASRPGSDIHPAFRDLPPTPPATPKAGSTDCVPPPRTSSRMPSPGVEEGVAFPALLGKRLQGEVVSRNTVPVRKPVVVGERVDEVMGGSMGSLKGSVGDTLAEEPDAKERDSWRKMLEEW